jgi:hypothetical protein
MTNPARTDRIITQARALVRAIEALGTIESTDPPALLFDFCPEWQYTMCV